MQIATQKREDAVGVLEAVLSRESAKRQEVLRTERLDLIPITLPLVEAVMLDQRDRVKALVGVAMPTRWPGRALIERAFSASLERIREQPEVRLWGDRLMITRGVDARVVGSVVFHGLPDDGIAEVGYGVDEDVQRSGYATEATRAAVEWALACEGIRAVHAKTFPWHRASVRVLEKLGMKRVGSEEHDVLGEQWVYGMTR